MGKVHDAITPELREWLAQQSMFFVATAPLAASGHVNCSPKGLDSFRVLGSREVGYLDLTGSGAETIAHVRENGRIVLMFCAFSGAPRIVRLHGRARIVLPGDVEWPALRARFSGPPGARAVIVATLHRISDSCGFGVPRYEFVGEREELPRWAHTKGEDKIAQYRRDKNARSLDGLAALGGEDSRDPPSSDPGPVA